MVEGYLMVAGSACAKEDDAQGWAAVEVQELLSKENGKGTASTHMRLEDDVAVEVFPLLDRKKKLFP